MERVQATAAAEEAMALYDAFWFHRCVLLPSPPPAPAPEREQQQPAISSSGSTSPTAGLRHRRTRSDEFQQGLEPLRVPNPNSRAARLETILSGKDGMVAAPQPQPLPDPPRRPSAAASRRHRRRRQRRGRSMSELEFEELKGLQDLGFTFADAEVDAELASIVPGLRRKRASSEEAPPLLATAASAPAAVTASSSADREEKADAAAPDAPRRPYLSEAWDDDEEEVRAMLRNWRIPPAGDGADLKQHLLVWAHTVASAVR